MRSKANLEQKIASYDSINNEFDSYKEFYGNDKIYFMLFFLIVVFLILCLDMGTKEGDKGMINEALTILDSIHARVGELEMAAIMYAITIIILLLIHYSVSLSIIKNNHSFPSTNHDVQTTTVAIFNNAKTTIIMINNELKE